MSELIAKHLVKQYGRKMVVNDVSLHLRTKEIVGLLGPNGAGKTTSFYMIVGLVTHTAGQVLLDSQDISHFSMPARARAGIGYLPQEPSVFRKLSVWDNIYSILELRQDLTDKQREAQCQQLLEDFHITHLKDSLGISLSGGERRRVEIARCLAMSPKFILLDEPFAGIDPISVVDIKKIIHQLAERDIGILITDHNVRETLDICERAYIVSEGRIICEGTPQTVLANKTVQSVYLGEAFNL